ncbi:protein of unknown function [Flavobacteriaceae bacterium MAR_2010_188]|nr:protein of unknown function [Flavobacteriaceae bacterium MAR_2010_188]
MKKIFSILLPFIFFCSCEDVIDVDLPEEEPRLIINALLRVDKSQEYVGAKIRMSLTSSFFEDITIAEVDRVSILYGVEDEQGFMERPFNSVLVETTPGTGIYEPLVTSTIDYRIRTQDVNPDVTFYLSVIYKDRFYFSKTMYVPTVPIDNLEIGDGFLFDEDETELKITYTDDASRDDFYLFDFDLGNFLVSEDEFYQGQQFGFSYYYDQDLTVGQELEVSILGADRQFFNYMNLLLQQTDQNVGVFETPKATIRGNIFDFTDVDNRDQFDNTGNPDTFPLGYFAVVQEYKETITITEN